MLPESLRAACAPVTVITGHYGVGKTNLALNMALDLSAEGVDVTLVDLDIVNPYFRSSEYRDMLEQAGARLVAPVLANSSVDVPSLSAGVDGAIEQAGLLDNHITLIDVGGDDAGATALGRYAAKVCAVDYAMIYVVNAYRNLTQEPAEAVEILHEIQVKSGLRVTAVVNNSHLRRETKPETVATASEFGESVANLLEVPLAAQTMPRLTTDDAADGDCADIDDETRYDVRILVTTPWE